MDIDIEHTKDNALIIYADNYREDNDDEDYESYRITFCNPKIENLEPRKAVYDTGDIDEFDYDLIIEQEDESGSWRKIASSSAFCAGLFEFSSIVYKAFKLNLKETGFLEEIDDGVDIDRYYYCVVHTNCHFRDYFEIQKVMYEGFGKYEFYNLIICMKSKAVRLTKISPRDLKLINRAVQNFINSAIKSYMEKRNECEILLRGLYFPTEKCIWERKFSEENNCCTDEYLNFFQLNENIELIYVFEEQDGKEVIEKYQYCKIDRITDGKISIIGDSFGGDYQFTVLCSKILELYDDIRYREKYESMTAEDIAVDFKNALSPQQITEFIENSISELIHKYEHSIINHYHLSGEKNNLAADIIQSVKNLTQRKNQYE